jgi:chromosome segregation ATPase
MNNLNEKLKDAIREHMKKLNTLLQNKNELQDKYDSLVKIKSNVTEELSFSKEKKMDKEKEIQELKQELKQELSDSKNIYSKQISELEDKLEELTNEFTELTKKIKNLEDEKESIQTELDTSKQKIIELERENSNYLKTIQEQKKEINNKIEEIEILNNQTNIYYETNNDIKIQELKSSNNLLLANKEEELKLIKQQLQEKKEELEERLQLLKAMEQQVKEYNRENNEINKIIDDFERDSEALFLRAGLNSTSKAGQVVKTSNSPNNRKFTNFGYNPNSISRQIYQEHLDKIELIKQFINLIQTTTEKLVADDDKKSFDQNIKYVKNTIDIINRRLESDEINLESLSENIKNILDVCNSAKKSNDQNYKKQFCRIHQLFMEIYIIIDPSKKLFNQMNTGKIEKNSRFEETNLELSDTSSVAK